MTNYECPHFLDSEFAAIQTMRDGAAGTGVSIADGQKHFDDEYGTTNIERFVTLRTQIHGKNPTEILTHPNITKAFVTQAFINLKIRIQNRRNNVTTESDFRIFAASNLYRIPKIIGDLLTIEELWIQHNASLELIPIELSNLQQLHVLNIVAAPKLVRTHAEIESLLKDIKSRHSIRKARQQQINRILNIMMDVLESGIEYWKFMAIVT